MADGSKQAAKQTGPEAEQPSQVRLKTARLTLVTLLLLLSCGHTIGQNRETVPFSCSWYRRSWYRRSCEECLSAMRAGGQRAGLLIVDRAECPPCREEDQACTPIPAGLKEWPETREEESPSEETTESGSGEEE